MDCVLPVLFHSIYIYTDISWHIGKEKVLILWMPDRLFCEFKARCNTLNHDFFVNGLRDDLNSTGSRVHLLLAHVVDTFFLIAHCNSGGLVEWF